MTSNDIVIELNELKEENNKLRGELKSAVQCIKVLNDIKINVKKILDSKSETNIFFLTDEDIKLLKQLNDNCDQVLSNNICIVNLTEEANEDSVDKLSATEESEEAVNEAKDNRNIAEQESTKDNNETETLSETTREVNDQDIEMVEELPKSSASDDQNVKDLETPKTYSNKDKKRFWIQTSANKKVLLDMQTKYRMGSEATSTKNINKPVANPSTQFIRILPSNSTIAPKPIGTSISSNMLRILPANSGFPLASNPIQASPVMSTPIYSSPLITIPFNSAPIISSPLISAPIMPSPVVSSPYIQPPNVMPLNSLHKCPVELCATYFINQCDLTNHCLNSHGKTCSALKGRQTRPKTKTIRNMLNTEGEHNSDEVAIIEEITADTSGELDIDKLVAKHSSILNNWFKCPAPNSRQSHCYSAIFNNKIQLQNHLLSKHLMSKFLKYCPYVNCGLQFENNEKMRAHLKDKHSSDDPQHNNSSSAKSSEEVSAAVESIGIVDDGKNGSDAEPEVIYESNNYVKQNESNISITGLQTQSNSLINIVPLINFGQVLAPTPPSQAIPVPPVPPVTNTNVNCTTVIVNEGDKKSLVVKCNVNNCGKLFASHLNFRKHLTSHFRCRFGRCAYKFDSRNQLEAHINTFHREDRFHECDVLSCAKTFRTETALRNHIKCTHLKIARMRCEFIGCYKMFKNRHALEAHKVVHNNERPFKCDFDGCLFSSKVKIGVLKHQVVHRKERPFVCGYDMCESAFKLVRDLNEHKTRVHLSKTVEGCVSAVKESYLKGHMKDVHSQDVVHCDLCNFKTNTVAKLREHKKSRHTTDRLRFTCEWKDCGKQFAQKYILNQHMLTHKNELRMTCDWPKCGHRANTRAQMRDHIMMKHSTGAHYSCHWPGCERKFVRKSALSTHLRYHTNEKPLICDFPGCKYRGNGSYFYRHRKRHEKKVL